MSDKFMFQNAAVKATEKRLLSPQQLQRLVDSATPQDAYKLLGELGFGQGASDFDAMFTREEQNAVDALKRGNVDGALDSFLLFCDYNNLKVLYKTSGNGAVYMPEGVYTIEDLREAVAGDVSDVSEAMKTAVLHLNKLQAEEKISPRVIDTVLDKALYSDVLRTAKKGGADVEEYFKSKIDYTNILSFLRCRKLGLSQKFFEDGYLDGGSFSLEFFTAVYESAVEVLKEKCRYTPYRDIVAKVVDDGNFVDYEVAVDNIALKGWREKFNDMFSPSPIIYYYFAKMTELKAVKLVVAGIKNHVEPALIKQRMREIYGA